MPSSIHDPDWGWGGGNDETRIDVSAKKTDPVRVVVEIPVEDLGLNEWEVSSLYDTNAQGQKVLEFENVYHWDDRISGVSNICPDKSGLDVKIKSEAIIDYAKYGTIEIKKVVENADGSTSSDKNTSFYFRITSADGRFSETFTLKNGESKKYQSLPVGTYYVDELNVPSGYTVEGYNREVVLKEANEYKTLTAVSYTHLDVYKRQDLQKSFFPSGPPSKPSRSRRHPPRQMLFHGQVRQSGCMDLDACKNPLSSRA